MSSKKYHTYSVRGRVFTDEDLKESLISLERNVSKIRLEIYCLHAMSSEEEFEERIELTDSSDSDYEYKPCEAPTSSEKKILKAKCVKKKSDNKKTNFRSTR
ncbi:unnamed protein product [Rhizophagus irregularis]|nr:unnamed protein product [Rhizophagus irregularis]